RDFAEGLLFYHASFADHDAEDGQAVDREPTHEALGRDGGESGIEVERAQEVDAERLHQARLAAEGGQAKGRDRGLEYAARVRLEGQNGLGGAHGVGPFARDADHGLVAEMQTVEIADRDDGAAGLNVGRRVMAEDAHGPRPLLLSLIRVTGRDTD